MHVKIPFFRKDRDPNMDMKFDDKGKDVMKVGKFEGSTGSDRYNNTTHKGGQVSFAQVVHNGPSRNNLDNKFEDKGKGTIVRYKTSSSMEDGEDESPKVILNSVFWAFKPCIEGF